MYITIIILYYYILYTILFFCSHLFLPNLFFLRSIHPPLISSTTFPILFPIFSPSQSPSIYLQFYSRSFYTCRYLHILIYVQSISNNLTPHKLTEVNVEWCSFNVCGVRLCFELVWCSCFVLVFDVRCYYYYIIIYYTYIIIYLILYSSSFF